jgi:threonine/homoserine/homoserine lactone efflux protein
MDTGFDWHPLLILWAVHLMAVMSPGQSFLVVSRAALSSGRPAALAATLACGVGVLPWAIGAMAGLALLFQQWPWLYAGLKAAGGIYLLSVAAMVWRHASEPLPEPTLETAMPVARVFTSTLLMQMTNPKVAVFFASIFVAVLPANPPIWLLAAILAVVFLNEIAWYALVALSFSAARPRAVYARVKPSVDRVMAGLLGVLGVKMLSDVRP